MGFVYRRIFIERRLALPDFSIDAILLPAGIVGPARANRDGWTTRNTSARFIHVLSLSMPVAAGVRGRPVQGGV